jgi:HSP20 family protein
MNAKSVKWVRRVNRAPFLVEGGFPMSNIVRWQPFGDLVSLRDAMDRLFEDSFVSPRNWPTMAGLVEPSLDVYETGNDVVVKVALPGMKPEDVDITLTGDVLTISGETTEETENKEKNYIRRERHFGSFTRSITLPEGLQADKAEAKFENGVLTLTIPKSEAVKPKKIQVKASQGEKK